MISSADGSGSADSVQVLTFDVDGEENGGTGNKSHKAGARASCWRWPKRVRNMSVQFILVAIVTPLVCASMGAVVDRIIYGALPQNNLNFNTYYLAYAGLLIAPLVLIRFATSNFSGPAERNRNVNIADFCMYVALTVAIGVALPRTMLAGPRAFQAVDHARQIFSANGLFDNVRGEDGVYNWLENVFSSIYDDSFASDKSSRAIDKQGRAFLLGGIRLRQSRVKPVQCTEIIIDLGLATRNVCYPEFSPANEDRTSYGGLNFTFYDSPYRTFDGRLSYPSDSHVSTTDNGLFSLAGFWTMFAADLTRNDSVDQLRAMQGAGWVDAQTRLIGIDAAVVFPDFPPQAIWVSLQMNVVVTVTGKFLPQPVFIVPNYLPATERKPVTDDPEAAKLAADKRGFESISIALTSMGNAVRNLSRSMNTSDVYLSKDCAVVVGGIFLIPFYLGIFIAFLYCIQVHVFTAIQDWRKHFHRFFTYTEMLWMLMLVLSWIFWCTAAYYQACSPSVFVQDPFVSATDSRGSFRTGAVVRLELQNLAFYWVQARNVLGFALFLHLFNFLKFLVKFKSLGALIRTLNLAAPELLSFSVSFSVIFIAFVTMFFVLFSVDAVEFMSYERSTISLWLGMLGELEVTSALWSNKAWSIPMIILFTFISVFVLLTLIVAIVSNAHEKILVGNEADEAVLREKRLVDAVMSVITKHVGRSQRVLPLSPSEREESAPAAMKHAWSGKEAGLSKLDPFQEPIQRWVTIGKLRASRQAMETPAQPNGGIRNHHTHVHGADLSLNQRTSAV